MGIIEITAYIIGFFIIINTDYHKTIISKLEKSSYYELSILGLIGVYIFLPIVFVVGSILYVYRKEIIKYVTKL